MGIATVNPADIAKRFSRLAQGIAPQSTSDPIVPSKESRALAAIGRLVTRRREVLLSFTPSDPAVVVVIAGRKHVHFGETTTIFTPGALVALPAGVPVDIVNEPDSARGVYQVLYVSLQSSLLRLFATTYPDLVRSRSTSVDIALPTDLPVVDAFIHAFESMLDPTKYGRAVIAHRLLEILLVLAARGRADWLWSSVDGTMTERVRRLVLFDPGRDWSAPAVARVLAVSTATLSRRLRADGVTLRCLLEAERMAQARRLLDETRESVGVIAQRCGYKSPSRFVARFRRHYGLTPGKTRSLP